jgi:uncharacterized protein YukJ
LFRQKQKNQKKEIKEILMALKNYGILKGRPIDRRLGFGSSPHYQVHLVDDDDDYRIAVNVKSKKSPSELLYLIDENYAHPLVDDLKELPPGFTTLEGAGRAGPGLYSWQSVCAG